MIGGGDGGWVGISVVDGVVEGGGLLVRSGGLVRRGGDGGEGTPVITEISIHYWGKWTQQLFVVKPAICHSSLAPVILVHFNTVMI